MPFVLHLTPGCPVVLTSNMCAAWGLINGAKATFLTAIYQNHMLPRVDDQPPANNPCAVPLYLILSSPLLPSRTGADLHGPLAYAQHGRPT